MHWPIILKALFAIILIVCMYYIFINKQVIKLRKICKLKRNGIKVNGEILDNYSFSNDGTKEYYPIIIYTTNYKKSYEIVVEVPKSKPWLVGEKVELFYDPKNPIDAVLNKPSLLFSIYFFLFFWIVLIIFFLLTIVFGSPAPVSTPIYP